MVQRHNAKQRHYWMIAACGLLIGTSALQGCKDDDTLTGQPSWLGNSIYERLAEDGNYTTMLKLIDDLGQHEVLSHTGSKTLFAADDKAFKDWFEGKNPWGVDGYDKLTLSQKKLLLNNSMINNAYLIELLSNLRGNPPVEGKCMRRPTASSIYDSVQIMKPDQMPNTEVWAKFKNSGKSIPILKDASAAPMIHFLPAFMRINNMTDADLKVLTNDGGKDTKEAWVNGKQVTERDITCKNGYIQKVSGVIESSPNMAEIIHQYSDMAHWARLMDRFCAPYYTADGTKEYNRLYNNQDSVYILRYYSDNSAVGVNDRTPDDKAVGATLKFDPGWNQYVERTSNMNSDAGAMFVPTNAALDDWWDNEGKDLKEEYHEIDSLPEATLADLINVNMRPSLVETVPSKFDRVLNDAMQEIGITANDIEASYMGCNGVVYMTNRVFPPAIFSSVAYPAIAHPSIMSIILWAINNLYFRPYLLSMDSKYSLMLPTNDAMIYYIDPASLGKKNPSALRFYWDESKKTVQAERWNCSVAEDGRIDFVDMVQKTVSDDVIEDNLKRLMDQLIIVGDVEDGHEYYKSKGGTLLRVYNDGTKLAFAGGWQIEHNQELSVNKEDIYVKSNGKSYQLNEQMPLATGKSVFKTLEELKDEGKGSLFLQLLHDDGADLLTPKLSFKSGKSYNAGELGEQNLRLLDNYNYTVYIPTDESIQKLIDDGKLPTWDDYEAQTEEVWGSEEKADSAQAIIKNIIVNFLRYHIQDHSVAVNMAPDQYDEQKNGETVVKVPKYESKFETMLRNPETGQYYSITVNNEKGQMWVMDGKKEKHNVIMTANGFYNRLCREYWFSGSENYATTYMASDAVVHQIDGVLLPKEMTRWEDELNKLKNQ